MPGNTRLKFVLKLQFFFWFRPLYIFCDLYVNTQPKRLDDALIEKLVYKLQEFSLERKITKGKSKNIGVEKEGDEISILNKN